MKKLKVFSAMLLSTALAACGGGGGSGSSSSSSSSSTSTVSGVVSKGIIKNATVTAYELDTAGVPLRTVGTATTNASGKYNLTLTSAYAGGPLKLVLSANSSGGTTMVCDVSTGCGIGVAFGQDYPLSSSFTLTAYQQSVSSGTSLTAQITPYTNMASAYIAAQLSASSPAVLDNTLVGNANSSVSQLVGVNIATAEPVDITNPTAVAAASPDALQYAAFNAGLGKVAFANAGGFETGITDAAASFADGQFTSSDQMTIGNLVSAVTSEAAATAGVSTTSLSATLTNITTNTTTGTYTPAPTPSVTLSAVAQAKALVSETRTWGTQIKALKTPADTFNANIHSAGALLHSSSIGFVSVFGKVLKGAIQKVGNASASSTGLIAKTYNYPLSFGSSTGLVSGTGTVTVSDNAGSLKLTFASTIAGVTNAGTLVTNIPSTVLGTPLTTLDLTGLSLAITGSASTTTPALAFTLTNASLVVSLAPTLTTINSASVKPTDIGALDLNGDATLVANGVSFNGTTKISVVANNVANPVAPLSLAEIALSGTFTDTTGSANASISMKINNAATFDTIGLLSHQPVQWVGQNLPGDPYGMNAAFSTAAQTSNVSYINYSANTDSTCGYAVIGSTYNYNCYPGDISGAGAAAATAIATNYANPAPSGPPQNLYVSYDPNYGTYYNAMLTYPDFESAGNFADATFSISSNVTLPGNPAATLVVTANRTAYGTSLSPFVGDVTAILTHNGHSVKFVATNTTSTGTGTLTISNPSGVKLIVTASAGNTTGTVNVGATQVATIESVNGIPMIHYSDGSFEALR